MRAGGLDLLHRIADREARRLRARWKLLESFEHLRAATTEDISRWGLADDCRRLWGVVSGCIARRSDCAPGRAVPGLLPRCTSRRSFATRRRARSAGTGNRPRPGCK